MSSAIRGNVGKVRRSLQMRPLHFLQQCATRIVEGNTLNSRYALDLPLRGGRSRAMSELGGSSPAAGWFLWILAIVVSIALVALCVWYMHAFDNLAIQVAVELKMTDSKLQQLTSEIKS